MSSRAAARSSDPGDNAPVRGFVPARNDAERLLERRAEELAEVAERRGIARYSSFLSDREQALATAALNRVGCTAARFDGGYPDAERRVLCIEPPYCDAEPPIGCVRIACRMLSGAAAPQHKDYLGSLMGLEIRREALGDIVLPEAEPGVAYVFALAPVAGLILSDLREVGRVSVVLSEADPACLPVFAAREHTLQSATVASLRLDAVLAAMLHCSRGMAGELISSGRIEINHIETESQSAPVYPQDVFTVRGRGRFRLVSLPGKSRKDRQIIEYFQY